jgi:CBS-domain-containing membrane protein
VCEVEQNDYFASLRTSFSKGAIMNQQLKPTNSAWLNTTLLPAFGAGVAIALLGFLDQLANIGLLIAPLGASATLIWMAPASPLARPKAVIGGSLVSAAIGLACTLSLGMSPLIVGLSVALAIIAMMTFDVLHAPAGALPVLVAIINPSPFVFLSALAMSTFILVGFGALYHRGFGRVAYPVKWL